MKSVYIKPKVSIFELDYANIIMASETVNSTVEETPASDVSYGRVFGFPDETDIFNEQAIFGSSAN